MTSSNGRVPAWEQNINTHVALSILSLKTGQSQSLQAFEAAHFTTTLLNDDPPVPDDAKTKLLGITTNNVQTAQSDSGTYVDTVQNLKGTQPNLPAWEQTINNADDVAIQNFTTAIRSSGTSAIAYIKTLPPQAQAPSAGLYQTGMSVVNSTINSIKGALGTVINDITSFLAGVWTKLTKVWDDVKGFCGHAIGALGSVFGLSTVLALTVPGSAVASGAVQSITGYVGWPASVGVEAARASFDKVLKRLDRIPNLAIASQQLGIEDVPTQGQCIVGHVHFGPAYATSQGQELTTESLQQIWQQVIDQTKNILGVKPLQISQQTWENLLEGQNGSTNGHGQITPSLTKPMSIAARKFVTRQGLLNNGFLDQQVS
ncbi:hypothetical protein EsH8_XII_000063 [Colletotrichum jinshuiense]